MKIRQVDEASLVNDVLGLEFKDDTAVVTFYKHRLSWGLKVQRGASEKLHQEHIAFYQDAAGKTRTKNVDNKIQTV